MKKGTDENQSNGSIVYHFCHGITGVYAYAALSLAATLSTANR